MKRKGTKLKTLPAGDRRRVSDMKNAWRKASPDQRREILEWMGSKGHEMVTRVVEREDRPRTYVDDVVDALDRKGPIAKQQQDEFVNKVRARGQMRHSLNDGFDSRFN